MSHPPRWMVATLALGLLALGSAGAWFYLAQRQYLQQVASANLLVIAQAKLDQIVAWRSERLADAAVLQESPFFVRAVARWLAGHQPELGADILTRLRSSKVHSGYDHVCLVDRAGRVVLATPGRTGCLDPDEVGALSAALRDRRPTMGDVHVSSDDSIPHLAIVVPLFPLSGRTSQPVGAVVRLMDPRRSLFRLVESWPNRSPSAEAVLVRRDRDSVLFLSERRFQPGPALPRRISLSRRNVPAVMAALGTEGVVQGVDYRGAKVLAALRAVPGTPWFLVVKVDEAEALAVWRTRAALVFAVLLGLVLTAGAAAIAVAQRSAKARFRRLYEAEAALGASEERYRLLFDGVTDAVFVHGLSADDMPAEFLAVNDVACARLGYTREELLRLTVRDIDAPESTVDVRAIVERLKRGETALFEQTHVAKDGRRIPVEVHVQGFPLHGRPVALSVVRDITERKRAEEAIQEREARLRTVVEASLDAIVAVNVEGRIVLFNGAAQDLFRYSREEALNQTAKILLREEVGEIHQDRLERFLGEGVGQCGHIGRRVERTFRRKDGTLFEAEVSMSGGRHDELRLVVLAVHDITERKRTEQALRETKEHLEIRVQERTAELEQALRAIEAETAERKSAEETVKRERQRLYDVLETLPVYVVLLSADYHVPFANRFFRQRFGESEGRRCYEYLFHRDTPCEICEAYTVLKTAAPHKWEWTGPDGRNYDLSDFPFSDEGGAPLILEMGIDITERKRVEEALQKAHHELEQRVAERTEELRRANEELRTDVTERKRAQEALRALARHLEAVREEEDTRIARQIHDDLGQALTALRLDLTWVDRKLPKGNTALRRRVQGAVALADEMITVGQRIAGELRPPILDDLGLAPAVEWYAQQLAKRSGLRLEVDFGAEEPVVADDLAVTAYRIVQEALTNVARHAQATHVTVRLGEQDDALTMEIRDDGQGFREEAAHDPRSFGIVGMRERAASHGGALAITSSPGAGTTVRVTFPLKQGLTE